MGEEPLRGLWLATGYNRNGVLLGAITAQPPEPHQNHNDSARWLEAFSWDHLNR